MKFTKRNFCKMEKKIIEALQAKFSGVEEKMLETLAKNLAKKISNEEEIINLVEGVTFQQVIESYADFRATQASNTASKNAVKAYEEKYNIKDGKAIESEPEQKTTQKTSPNPPTKNETVPETKKEEPRIPPIEPQKAAEPQEPAWAKEYREKIDKLYKRIEEEDAAKKQNALNDQLITILKEKGIRESFFNPMIKGRKFKDEDEIKAYAEEVSVSFEADKQQLANEQFEGNKKPVTGDDTKGVDALLQGIEDETAELAKSKK